MSAPAITIMVEEPLWRREGRSFLTDLRRTIRAALERVEKRSSAGLTVLLAGDAKLEELNRHHRGKAKPTNVLSFPSADDAYLGDIAIAYGVTAREARDGQRWRCGRRRSQVGRDVVRPWTEAVGVAGERLADREARTHLRRVRRRE